MSGRSKVDENGGYSAVAVDAARMLGRSYVTSNLDLPSPGQVHLQNDPPRVRHDRGMTAEEIVDTYPDLEAADVQEALRYAAEALRERELPLAGRGSDR